MKETLEEATERILLGEDLDLSDYDKRHILKAMLSIAKWQQEQCNKMYSEEEVRNIVEQTIEKFYKHIYVETKSEMKELWFDQIKTK